MRFKNAVKKIAALSAGSFMVGSTLMGAFAAADLANYPEPFVKGGVFNGVMVVGDKAAAEDVIGITDIAVSLQAASTRAAPTAKGATTTLIEGNVVHIARGGDMLEIGESVGSVRSTVTSNEWPALEGGDLVTSEGSTSYAQYIRLDTDNNASVVYEEDEDDEVGAFLKYKDGNPIFELQIQFEEGLDSTHSGGTLNDLINEKLKIMGREYEIVKAIFNNGNDVEIIGIAGAISDKLMEGETKTYNLEGKTYKISASIFSGGTADEAVFTLESGGKTMVSDELKEAGTDTLDDGTIISVTDLLTSTKDTVPDQVQFSLGANKLTLTDTDMTDNDFSPAGTVEVDNENIEDAKVEITASNLSTTKLQITDIKYRLFADAPRGDVYVAPGHGVRETLDESQGMLHDEWDIVFAGLLPVGETTVKLAPQGDDSYNLEFETIEGLKYSVDFVDNSNDNSQGWKFGDEDDDFIFQEGYVNVTVNSSVTNAPFCGLNTHAGDKIGFSGNETVDRFDANIDETDWFLLSDIDESDRIDDNAFTHILEYDSIDVSNKLVRFTDLASEGKGRSIEITYTASAGCSAAGERLSCREGTSINGTTSNLVVGGKTYKVWIVNLAESSTKKPLMVDLDGDGDLDGSCVPVTVKGGGVLNLSRYGASTPGQNITGISTTDNTSTRARVSDSSFFFDVLTDKENFDESLLNERIATNISGPAITPSNNVDLQVVSPTPQGGFADSNVLISNYTFKMNSLEDNDDIKRGMSAYGVLFEEFDDTGSNDADSLTVMYPHTQRGADVYLKLGATTAFAGEAGDAVVLSKIEVGAIKLASEVSNVKAQNVIAVGGPCANAAAAEIMGNPADCTAGFEDGKGRIMLYENDGNVAMVVAGYGAGDTRRAAQVVANYKDYAETLTGDSVEVTHTAATGTAIAATEKPAMAEPEVEAPATTTTG